MQDTEVLATPRAKRRCLTPSDIRLSSPVQDKQTFALSSSQVNNFIEEVREAPNRILELQIEEANRYLANRAQELADEAAAYHQLPELRGEPHWWLGEHNPYRIERNRQIEEGRAFVAAELERHRRNIAIIEEVD